MMLIKNKSEKRLIFQHKYAESIDIPSVAIYH